MEIVALGLLVLIGFLVAWIVLAGDREQDIVDEEPILDTRGPDDR